MKKLNLIIQQPIHKVKLICNCKHRRIEFTAPKSLERLTGFCYKRIAEKKVIQT